MLYCLSGLELYSRWVPLSHIEPVMAPKLHTSQIFKGLTYACLNKQQANLLQYLGVIFSKPEKNNYTPEICKNSKITPLRIHDNHNCLHHVRQIFLCVAETHAIFLCFTCSSDGPLQITRGLMGYERKQNNGGAKALQILIFL